MHKKLAWMLSLLVTVTSSVSLATPGTAVRTVYTTTPVSYPNWVVLIPSLTNTSSQIVVTDTGGQTMEVGTAAASAGVNQEVRAFLIPAANAGNGVSLHMQIQSGQRVSIRSANSVAATTGENDLNVVY